MRVAQPEAVDNYPYEPTAEEWQIVLYGDPENDSRGGHMTGVGRQGKTETGPEWTATRFKSAIRQTIAHPDKLMMRGDALVRIKLVAGVIFRVETMPARRGRYRLVHAYPMNGDGVTMNTVGAAMPRPFDGSVLL